MNFNRKKSCPKNCSVKGSLEFVDVPKDFGIKFFLTSRKIFGSNFWKIYQAKKNFKVV